MVLRPRWHPSQTARLSSDLPASTPGTTHTRATTQQSLTRTPQLQYHAGHDQDADRAVSPTTAAVDQADARARRLGRGTPMHVEENLADLGGEADDGDDSDPHKFIEKSLHYQDMLMTKRHAEERVTFFEEFKKTMPKGKDPKKKMELYQNRVKAVNGRIEKFRAKYAKNRAEGKRARAERIAKDRASRADKEALGKDLLGELRKDTRSKEDLALKAALAAMEALGDDATEEDRRRRLQRRTRRRWPRPWRPTRSSLPLRWRRPQRPPRRRRSSVEAA